VFVILAFTFFCTLTYNGNMDLKLYALLFPFSSNVGEISIMIIYAIWHGDVIVIVVACHCQYQSFPP